MAVFDELSSPVNGIRVGVGGWTFAPWRNHFYPKGLVQRRELEYASRKLSAIEINSTYYGTQKPATYAKWAAETPEGFMFSVKAPMRIMQSRRLEKTGPQIEDFLGGIFSLGCRLGPIVWQFDANQRLQRDSFAEFLDLLPKQIEGCTLRHVLDVRDREFVNADYLGLLRKHDMATVFTDSPDYPSFADVTSNFVYARLMRSRNNVATGYGGEELDDWAKCVHAWANGEQPANLPYLDTGRTPQLKRDVFVFFISAAKEHNPAAAMALIERL
ncbi:DUF72 domain-containing protein [Dyella choica]|uniref:DUF72 domain-containing protein n=1 Tax=Dyella choica TaxID=1927959 RepID=A0A432LZZ3_9GAMM|nr:DUF72 domain-containing protein [Dyella choica]RUL69590.1 DUF72 domain-containing protein [Dyella choica]